MQFNIFHSRSHFLAESPQGLCEKLRSTQPDNSYRN